MIRALIINHLFIITRPHHDFFINNTAFRLIIWRNWQRKSKLQLKKNWKQKLNSSTCKKSKWNRNSLNNQIITAFRVLFFVVIFDDEQVINFESPYEEALSIFDDNDVQIHYKKPPNSFFVNNCFCDGLMAWEVNVNIQPIFNHYIAVAYVCAYFSKSENEYWDAFKKQLKNYDQMKLVGNAYIKKRECSV